jgi:2-polyprenyl-6-hydroxyphenyl methylase/3-demethylubiquinone-9 3-methyltransferase
MLHKLNPVRVAYIRDRINQHWQVDEHGRRPLEGKSALDVGCGAGLLAEPLARLGAKVTAIDAAPELIEVAREHARGQGLEIDYRAVAVEEIDGAFDLVTSLEVIEHVADPRSFIDAIAKRLARGGLLILSTPNQTGWSKLLTITLAEGFGRIPKGTHDFDAFIAPDRMKQLLADAGLRCLDFEGIAWSPTRGLRLSEDLSLNYLVTAVHAA